MADGGLPRAKRSRLLDAVRDAPVIQPQQQAAQQQQQQQDQDDADFDIPMPSDVEAAFLFLRNELQTACRALSQHQAGHDSQPRSLPGLVLVSQLHSMLKDKRGLEGELDELRRKNTIRMFKLPTGVDEHGVLLTSEYLELIRAAAATATRQQQQQEGGGPSASKRPSIDQAMAEAFCTRVVPNYTQITISQAHLLALLHKQPNQPSQPAVKPPVRVQPAAGAASHRQQQLPAAAVAASAPVPTAAGPVSADAAMASLLQLGVLARHLVDEGSYVLCCPGLGPVIKSILAGRKELLAFIAKKPRGEVPERTLLGNSLMPASSNGWKQPARPADTEGGFLRPLVIEIAAAGEGQAAAAGKRGKAGRSAKGAQASAGLAAGSGTPALRLRHSVLGVGYHLKDLMGRGDVVRVHSTAGELIRLAKHS